MAKKVRVTDIGEYIRHQSCQRRFRLGHNDGELFEKLPFSGKPLHTMDPVLAEQGARRAFCFMLKREGCMVGTGGVAGAG